MLISVADPANRADLARRRGAVKRWAANPLRWRLAIEAWDCYMPAQTRVSPVRRAQCAAESSMQNVLIVIHLIVVLALVAVVLLQRSEGGGLGLGGGSSGVSGFLTGRGQANALTRATTILAAAFFLTSILLTMLQTYGHKPSSILDTAPAATSAPAPGQPASTNAPAAGGTTVYDQLKQHEGGDTQPAPAAPAN